MSEISGNHRELHQLHLKPLNSQVSVTLLGSLDHVMAAQGQLEMVLSLAPWAVFDDGWYHLMIRAYENPLVSLNKAGYQTLMNLRGVR